ncbi:2,3-diketo-L-gulonate TRAP transporter small permease protein [Gammaproteobacteria bacterium]|nr:2,3-diketo-L-gulonate TRAP transporter small permease protein [Gammaproteobacteria bacterium]
MIGIIQKITNAYFSLLRLIMVICLAIMLCMVFTNVCLRYLGRGIDIAEELPRFLFIWMTFLGAIVGFKERAHIGVDFLIEIIPKYAKQISWLTVQLLILLCAVYILYGTYLTHDLLVGNVSTVMRLPEIYVFGVSYFTGASIILMSIGNILRFFIIGIDDQELIHKQITKNAH